MSATASNDHGGNAKKSKSGLPLIYLITGIPVVLAVIILLVGWSLSGSSDTKGSSASGTASAAKTASAVQQPTGTLCPPFSLDGATCDITTEGTAWIGFVREPGTHPRICLQNALDQFAKIQYLGSDGQSHDYDLTSKTAGDGIEPTRIRFVPKGSLTLAYSLAPACPD